MVEDHVRTLVAQLVAERLRERGLEIVRWFRALRTLTTSTRIYINTRQLFVLDSNFEKKGT